MPLSIGETLLYAIIPFGPYYARLFKLKGTTDHIWTHILILNIFPFSLIPMFMMYSGAIKEGKVDDPAILFNYKMIIPIILRFVAVFILSKYIENRTLAMALLLLSNFLVSYILNFIDRMVVCEKVDNDKFVSSIVDTITETLFTNLCAATIFIMYFGFTLSELEESEMSIAEMAIGDQLGIVRNIGWVVGFIYVKLVMNMDNINNRDFYCTQKMSSTSNIIQVSVFVFYVLVFIWMKTMEILDDKSYDED